MYLLHPLKPKHVKIKIDLNTSRVTVMVLYNCNQILYLSAQTPLPTPITRLTMTGTTQQ